MQLSSELFERIVGIVSPAQAAPAAGDVVSPAGSRVMDRRGATRIPFGARAKITYENPEHAGVTETVMLQDISVQGISFVSADWIALEEVLVVSLKDQQDQELRLRCKVQRCEQGGYGGVSYVIGTNFLELVENNPEQSGATVASSKKPAPRKRRASAPPAGISGRLKKLNPLRLFGSRNFDDFTAVGEGSKPSRELLEQQEAEEAEEAQAAEKSAEAGEENPSQAPIVTTPTGSDPTTPRKSSIFLRTEKPLQAPAQEVPKPQEQEQPELKEQPEVAATVAPPPPTVEELPAPSAPPAEVAESSSISADDIASILNAIPMEVSRVSELPAATPVVVSETQKNPPLPPVAVTVIDPPVAAVPAAVVIPGPVAVTQPAVPTISQPVAVELPVPLLAVPVNPESVAIQTPSPAPAAPINPEPVAIETPTPLPAAPTNPQPVLISLPTPAVTAVSPEPTAIQPVPSPVAPVNPEPVAIRAPIPQPTPAIPEPVKVELPNSTPASTPGLRFR